MDELLDDPPEGPPPGAARQVAASQDLVAWQVSTGDPDNRHTLQVGESLVSDPDPLMLEAPRVLRGEDADYACWRSLALTQGETLWPWQAHCSRREAGGEWQDLDLPFFHASPYFEPAMALDEHGHLLLSFTNQHSGDDLLATPHALYMHIRVMRWSEELGWEVAAQESTEGYPLHPSMVYAGGSSWVAVAAGRDIAAARYDRQVELYHLRWPVGGRATYGQAYLLPLQDTSGHSYGRQERPALQAVDGGLALGVLAWDDRGTHLLRSSFDGAWGTPEALDDSGRVLSHITPVWTEDRVLVWARRGPEGGVELCSAALDAQEPSCQDAGANYLDSMAAGSDGVWLSVSAGGGAWELIQLVL